MRRDSRAELELREVPEGDWGERLRSAGAASENSGEPTPLRRSSDASECGCSVESLPVILEEPLASNAWGNDVWLAKVDMEAVSALRSRWIDNCSDAVCVISGSDGASTSINPAEMQRVANHVEAGRQVFILVWQRKVVKSVVVDDVANSADACSSPDSEFTMRAIAENSKESEARVRRELARVVDGCAFQVCVMPHPKRKCCVEWDVAWERCRDGLKAFCAEAITRREVQAKAHVVAARDAFVDWCSKGTKVVIAASEAFRKDAADLRLARDLITRNIDAAYLAHVFSSLLVGKYDKLCTKLGKLRAPDLAGQWGRHATRRVMEDHLKERLELGLRQAMREALEEVTSEMAKQELPALQEIQRVAQRGGANVPWDAQVRRLACDLQPDELQHFALHFFGSLSLGVLSGLGAAALEVLLGELALGPVGLVVGVATFVAIGVQTADWPSVRTEFLRLVRTKQLDLVEKAKLQLDFPGLCERRKRRILEQMDVILHCLLNEVSSLAEAASEFARCGLALQRTQRSLCRKASGA